jgi:hypothetical protein
MKRYIRPTLESLSCTAFTVRLCSHVLPISAALHTEQSSFVFCYKSNTSARRAVPAIAGTTPALALACLGKPLVHPLLKVRRRLIDTGPLLGAVSPSIEKLLQHPRALLICIHLALANVPKIGAVIQAGSISRAYHRHYLTGATATRHIKSAR